MTSDTRLAVFIACRIWLGSITRHWRCTLALRVCANALNRLRDSCCCVLGRKNAHYISDRILAAVETAPSASEAAGHRSERHYRHRLYRVANPAADHRCAPGSLHRGRHCPAVGYAGSGAGQVNRVDHRAWSRMHFQIRGGSCSPNQPGCKSPIAVNIARKASGLRLLRAWGPLPRYTSRSCRLRGFIRMIEEQAPGLIDLSGQILRAAALWTKQLSQPLVRFLNFQFRCIRSESQDLQCFRF